jgi:hypothetical protein
MKPAVRDVTLITKTSYHWRDAFRDHGATNPEKLFDYLGVAKSEGISPIPSGRQG